MKLNPRYIPTVRHTDEVLLFETRVLASGGTISLRTKQHLDKFVLDCKESGAWDKLLEVMPFCGDQLAAALVKLKVAGASAVLTAVNFVSGDYVETGTTGGLNGNGSTKYLDTNYNPNTTGLPLAAHLSGYLRDDAPANGTILGVNGVSVQYAMIQVSPVNATARIHETATATMPAAGNKGFYYADRSGATSLTLYRNNVSQNTSGISTNQGIASLNMYAFARNNVGTVADYLTGRLSFISIGLSMTAAERTAFYNIVQTLQLNLNRNV